MSYLLLGLMLFIAVVLPAAFGAESHADATTATVKASEQAVMQGDRLASQNRWDDAISKYEEAIKYAPENSRLYFLAACAYWNSGKFQQSRSYYEKATALDPTSSESWFGLGNTLLKLNESRSALDAFKKTIDLAPRYALAWSGLGDASRQLKEWNGSIEAYRTYLKTYPKDPAVWQKLGSVLEETKKYDEAIQADKHCLELDPENIDGLVSLGEMFFRSDQITEAKIYFERVSTLKLSPADGSKVQSYLEKIRRRLKNTNDLCLLNLNNNGVELLNSGNYTEAIAKFETALRANPEYRLSKQNLAIAFNNYGLQLENDPEQALRMFHRASLLDRDNETTRQNIHAVVERLGYAPNTFNERVKLANQLSARGDYAGAIIEYLEALKIREDESARHKLEQACEKGSEDLEVQLGCVENVK
jgi:tetratricopeptide (TPR) repeat protein